MDIPFSTISSALSENMSDVAQRASVLIPSDWSHMLRHVTTYIPVDIDLVRTGKFMLYFTVISLVFGLLGRIILGKRSSLNHSLSSAMGILFIYAVTVIIYTLKPWNLQILLSPLPFVSFSREFLFLFPIRDAQFPALCSQFLALIMLSFCVNLLDAVFPQGDSAVGWYLLRFICIIFSMVLHLVVQWAVQAYVPDLLADYAPMALLILLIIMLLSGFASLVLGMAIAVSNPFLGAMYSFFFSSLVGKQVSKAVFTTAILFAILYLMEFFDYTVICITTAALSAYIPLVFLLLVLWYLIGHVL